MLVAHMGGKSPSGSGFLGHWCRFILVVFFFLCNSQDIRIGGGGGGGSSNPLRPQRSSLDVIFPTSMTIDHRPYLLCSSGMQ